MIVLVPLHKLFRNFLLVIDQLSGDSLRLYDPLLLISELVFLLFSELLHLLLMPLPRFLDLFFLSLPLGYEVYGLRLVIHALFQFLLGLGLPLLYLQSFH